MNNVLYSRIGALCVLLAACGGISLLASDYFVAPNGDDANPGTSLALPLETVQSAVDRAGPGDTVFIRGGTYREFVTVTNSGTHGADLTICAYQEERPILKGSDIVTGWVPYSNNIWMVTNWLVHSQQVFEDGYPLRMVGWPNEAVRLHPNRFPAAIPDFADMIPGSFYYDPGAFALFVWTRDGSPPSNHTMEVSVRVQVLNAEAFGENGNQSIRVEGVSFMHCNSMAHSPHGWAGVLVGDASCITNCRISHCDAAGVLVGEGSRIEDCEIAENGYVGFFGSNTNMLIRNCHVISNNYRGFCEYWGAAGLKIIPGADGAAGATVEGCEIAWNFSTGLWFDLCRVPTPIVVRNNFIHHNGPFPNRDRYPAGIMLEASAAGALIHNNLLIANKGKGFYISGSDNVFFHHNTIAATEGLSHVYAGLDVRELSPGVWSTLTGNRLANNIIHGDACVYASVIRADATNPTAYVADNFLDGNVYSAVPSPQTFALGGVGIWSNITHWTAATGWDGNSLHMNVAFDMTCGDGYGLPAGSVAIDRGITSGISEDYLGIARPLDGNGDGSAAPDPGAYEFVNTAADSDGDGLLDINEMQYGTSPTRRDTDGDAMSDSDEITSGTDPLDSESLLKAVLARAVQPSYGAVVQWPSVSNRLYEISVSSNLNTSAFEHLETGIGATPPLNVYTDLFAHPHRFYRIGVYRED